ncbi:MAG: hypothetical protein ACKVJE_19885 [Pseudomonadales bacterium]|jgi:hypothetical protein
MATLYQQEIDLRQYRVVSYPCVEADFLLAFTECESNRRQPVQVVEMGGGRV